MNAATRSIIGYQVSDSRGVGPCILAMRMAFRGLAKLPEKFKFIADGYSAYPLAAMEFAKSSAKPLPSRSHRSSDLPTTTLFPRNTDRSSR